MPKPRALGTDAKIRGVTEATYGTVPTDGYSLLFARSFDLDAERPLAVDPLLGQGRRAQGAYYERLAVGGSADIPVDLRAIGFWLHGLLGAATASDTYAAGSISFSGQPANNSTITLNGTVWTLVTGSPTGNQTQIGVNLAATLTALATNLNASADAELVKCTWTAGATALTIVHDAAGTTGNAFSLAASASSNGTVSAATLLGGGYSHVWTDAVSAVPSKTFEIGHPELATPKFLRYSGCKLGSLALPLAGNGPVNAQVQIIGQNKATAAATIDASPTEHALRRFEQGRGSVTVAGAAVAYLTGGQLNFTNNLETVETIRADGLIEGIDEGSPRASGSVTVRFSDAASQEAVRAAVDAQTAVALAFAFADPAAWSLGFSMPRVLLSAGRAPIGGGGGISQTFDYQAEYDDTAEYSLAATLVNDVAAYA